MKKIILTILMTVVTAAVFAYEPKVECFKVSNSNDLALYSEKVKVEEDTFRNEYMADIFTDIIRFEEIHFYNLEYEAELQYLRLEQYRSFVKFNEAEIALTEKYGLKVSDVIRNKVEDTIAEAVLKIPFVTKENFYKLTKNEYKKIFTKYMRDLIKENK